MPAIRLLWLIDSLTVGGAESLLVPFARKIERQRFELHVCCLSTIAGNPIDRLLRDEGVSAVNLAARRLLDFEAFRRLENLVRGKRIDLVHAHLTYSAIWAAWLSRRVSIPSIATLHVAPPANLLKASIRDRLMRFAVNRWSNAVVMVSAALRDAYVAGGGISPSKIRVVHNGIDVERFRRDKTESRERLLREFEIPADAPIVVTVSVLREGKGVDVLLEAVRSSGDSCFLIVGDGPKRSEWSSLAARLGVADRIRWAGYRPDVDAILPGCDLFVHPSLDDAFPTVLLEAMAAGLPVVASRVGGIPEIVEPQIGTLVEPGHASQLAEAITDVLSDRQIAARMSENARASASRRFSTEAWIERLTAVYDEVLREAQAP